MYKVDHTGLCFYLNSMYIHRYLKGFKKQTLIKNLYLLCCNAYSIVTDSYAFNVDSIRR